MMGRRRQISTVSGALVGVVVLVLLLFLFVFDAGAASSRALLAQAVSNIRTAARNTTKVDVAKTVGEVGPPAVPSPSLPTILNDVLPDVNNLILPRQAVGEANELNYVHDPGTNSNPIQSNPTSTTV